MTGSDAVFDAAMAHRDLIVSETLAAQFGASGNLDDIPAGDVVTGSQVSEVTIGADERVRISLARI